jgi:hypothetical protein
MIQTRTIVSIGRNAGWGSRVAAASAKTGNILHLYVLSAAARQGRQSVSANINDQIVLTGFSLSPKTGQAGETVLLTLCWQATTLIEHGYTVFTHVLNSSGV